jgi:polyphosphate kinase
VAPIEDPLLQKQIEALLDLYLSDTGAWHMHSDGHFSQRQHSGEAKLTQMLLMERWRGGLGATGKA